MVLQWVMSGPQPRIEKTALGSDRLQRQTVSRLSRLSIEGSESNCRPMLVLAFGTWPQSSPNGKGTQHDQLQYLEGEESA